MSIVPIRVEINRLQKLIDDLEWEQPLTQESKNPKRELEALLKQEAEGELYYVLF